MKPFYLKLLVFVACSCVFFNAKTYAAIDFTHPSTIKAWPEILFSQPRSVALDSHGNMYAADSGNNRIIRYENSAWTIFANSDQQNMNTPFGVFVDTNDNVYVADTYNNQIQKYDATSETWVIIGSGGSGLGEFNQPYGVVTDSQGNIYVSDQGNNRIQKFDGETWTIIGTSGAGVGQFNSPRQIAIDPLDKLYVIDTMNQRFQMYDGNDWHAFDSASSGIGALSYPSGIAVDNNREVYVSDTSNGRIVRFDGENWSEVLSGSFDYNYGIAVTPDGNNIFVADTGAHSIIKYDIFEDELTTYGGYTGAGKFDNPTKIATDKNGHIYVSDSTNNQIQVFDGTNWSTISTTEDREDFMPYGIAVDSHGVIYVTNPENRNVMTYNGEDWSIFQNSNEVLDTPMGIAVDKNDNVYVTDTDFGKVYEYINDTWTELGTDTTFDNPVGIAIAENGDVYVVSSGDSSISVLPVGSTTWNVVAQGEGSDPGQFEGASDIAFDSLGNLYVADDFNSRIQMYNGNTWQIYGTPGIDLGQFYKPYGIVVDKDENVFVTDNARSRVQEFSYSETQSAAASFKTFKKDTRCLWSKPGKTTWIKLEPATVNGVSGMNLIWTQYGADKISVKIDDGTGNYPWNISNMSNDGHEFLPNVASWQNIKIKPINHCKSGEYSVPVSADSFQNGWYNIK